MPIPFPMIIFIDFSKIRWQSYAKFWQTMLTNERYFFRVLKLQLSFANTLNLPVKWQ